MSESEMAVFEYRLGQSGAFRTVRKDIHERGRELDELTVLVRQHSEQISGDGGLQNSVRGLRADLHAEVGSLRRAFYGLTGAIIVGAISLISAIVSHAV